MIRFILRTIKGDKKLLIIILLILSLLSSFQYVFLSMYTTIQNRIKEFSFYDTPTIIIFLVVLLSSFFILIVNNYYVQQKQQDIAILLLCGSNNQKIMKYNIIQFSSILIVSFVIGNVLGIEEVILFNYIYKINNIKFSLVFSSLTLYYLILLMLIMCNIFSNIYTKNMTSMRMIDYLNNKVDLITHKYKNKTFQYGFLTFVGIAFIYSSVVLMITLNNDSMYFLYFAGSMLGEVLLIKYVIPFLFNLLHDKLLMKSKTLLFIMNDFMNLSSSLSHIIFLNCITIPMLLISLISIKSIELEISMICCYVISLIMMLLIFIIKFNTYYQKTTLQTKILKSLGYKKKQIFFIQNMQILLFVLFLLIPIVIYGAIMINSLNNNLMTIDTVILLISSYIFIYFIICIYMFINFKRKLQEVY